MKSKLLILGLLFASSFNLAAMTDDDEKSASFEMFGGAGKNEDKAKQQQKESRLQTCPLPMIIELADCYEKAAETAVQELKTPEVGAEFKDADEQVDFVIESVLYVAEELVERLNRVFLELEDQDFLSAVRTLYGKSRAYFFRKTDLTSATKTEPYFSKFQEYESVEAVAAAIKQCAADLRAGVEVLRKQYLY